MAHSAMSSKRPLSPTGSHSAAKADDSMAAAQQDQPFADEDGWTTCVDESTGESYYWNTITNQVTWSNPYAGPDNDTVLAAPGPTETATRALPGSAPTASHAAHHSTEAHADDLNAIHPSRRAFFSSGSPDATSSAAHPSSASVTTNYNATAASHLDLLLHSIDRAKAGDTQSLVDTVSSEKSLSSVMTASASIRPTAITGGALSSGSNVSTSLAIGDDASSSGYGFGAEGGGGASLGPSAKSLNNLYFDEQAYQDQRNLDKAMEAMYGKEKRKRLTKSELEKYKVKREQQKKKKYLSKFENM